MMVNRTPSSITWRPGDMSSPSRRADVEAVVDAEDVAGAVAVVEVVEDVEDVVEVVEEVVEVVEAEVAL